MVFTARNSGQISGYVNAVNTSPSAILAASADPAVQVIFDGLEIALRHDMCMSAALQM